MSADNAGAPDLSSSSGAGTSAVGSGHAHSISNSSTSYCSSPGSARHLPAIVDSEPTLSIASCINKATSLSAACQHVACLEDKNISTASSSTVGLACSLLATAAAALNLQGAAALPFVSAALPAATYLLYSPCVSCRHQHNSLQNQWLLSNYMMQQQQGPVQAAAAAPGHKQQQQNQSQQLLALLCLSVTDGCACPLQQTLPQQSCSCKAWRASKQSSRRLQSLPAFSVVCCCRCCLSI